jgi:hypothetical protein
MITWIMRPECRRGVKSIVLDAFAVVEGLTRKSTIVRASEGPRGMVFLRSNGSSLTGYDEPQRESEKRRYHAGQGC